MNSGSYDPSGENICTTSVMSGDAFFTDNPCRTTSCGSTGSASDTRFCTCTCAVSRFVPSLKVMVSFIAPSLVLWLLMYIMFSTPLTCSSMGVATVEATVWALAPGNCVLTTTVGGAISGYCAMG